MPAKTAEPAVDPLADVREAFGTADDSPAVLAAEEPTVLSNEDQADAARAELVAAWHADTTAVGFLHRGGGCGCRYLAGRAVETILPVQPNETDADEE